MDVADAVRCFAPALRGPSANCAAGPGEAGVTAMCGLIEMIGRPMRCIVCGWGRGVECERGGRTVGGAAGRGFEPSEARGLPAESEEAVVYTDVEGDCEDGAGEKMTMLSSSRPSLLDGDAFALLSLPPSYASARSGCERREVVARLSSSLSALGSGGSGRLSRSASGWVPAGNTGGGAIDRDGLLALSWVKMTGEMGDGLYPLRGVEGDEEQRGSFGI